MNDFQDSLEEFDRSIIKLWDQCYSVESIADDLGVDEGYIEAVIDDESLYEGLE